MSEILKFMSDDYKLPNFQIFLFEADRSFPPLFDKCFKNNCISHKFNKIISYIYEFFIVERTIGNF